MARFFIDRPVFAWVVSILIVLLGIISITRLPVAQYPQVAPPSVSISANYAGASAETLTDTVTSVIEQQLNGIDNLLYMSSASDANGSATITLFFEPGTDPDVAQVQVQNKVQLATPSLPQTVQQQGVVVAKATRNFMMFITLSSEDGSMDEIALGNYLATSVLDPLRRVDGVGEVIQFGTQYAMRVWLDPDKLVSYNLSPTDVNEAIRNQNAQVPVGQLGSLPAVENQQLNVILQGRATLREAEQFEDIVLRVNPDGSRVYLRDVARVEMGGQDYSTKARIDGKAASAAAIKLAPTGNALDTADGVRAEIERLKQFFPPGVKVTYPLDTSTFVKISVEEVLKTLVEAIILVFLVMYLFLQNFRATLIPTLVVPVALLGTCGLMAAFGFSINVLTMFGMVLAIGILVDDAIVVVENVERIMSEEGLPPLQATKKAMGQISGAIIGVTVVLIAVFVPLAFFSGSVGNIYRQFSTVMVASIAFSAFLALSLTPALCATLLKPVVAGHAHASTGFFGWFNRHFTSTAKGYESVVQRLLKKAGRYLVIYVAIIGAVAVVYMRLPTSFLPAEDQGNIIVNVQLPPGATQERTTKVMEQVEGFMLKQPEVESMVGVIGFSFSGQGQNAALGFVTLKDWSERQGPGQSAQALAGRSFGALMGIRDAFIFPLSPPPIPELGNASGFTFRLQDRAGKGREALIAARNQLLGMASKSKVITQVRPDGLEDAPQLQIDIDRDKASALGVSFSAINSTISTALGSSYVNDFPNAGRLQRVVVQADATARMQPDDLLKFNVINSSGKAVPLSAFATTRWVNGAMQTVRYNGYSAIRIGGSAAPGYSTGEAMAEMEKLASQLPAGFGFEWTGQSREEKLAGSQATILYAFAILAVFLCLAALYESWSIPLSVILVVPLGVLGVVLATLFRGYANDVYFQVGLITIIGLSAKNAILIIEFAKDLQAQGKTAIQAALMAAHLRFRPIVMTSLAFILGVLPLALASGAGSASQRAIGTGVIGGMVAGTILAVFFVPIFFVVVRSIFKGSERQRQFDAQHGHQIGAESHE
jgi:multidrug efflux pump